MRLTLRTLLAYLDDVLETPDAQELSKKIDESKFATELVHRIRTSVRKVRLDAPKLDGKGMGLDPNTVAEYLDSTLPPDRVPDFEKVCLESERHLAEVAACHQVLAIVLGEPAKVENSLRERIYRIGAMSTAEVDQALAQRQEAAATEAVAKRKVEVAEPEPVPPPKVAAVASPAPSDSQERLARPKPEVPDYLREASRPRFWPIALTLLLAFGLGIGVLRMMGPLDASHPLAGMFGMKSQEVANNSLTPNGQAETVVPPINSKNGEPTNDAAAGGEKTNKPETPAKSGVPDLVETDSPTRPIAPLTNKDDPLANNVPTTPDKPLPTEKPVVAVPPVPGKTAETPDVPANPPVNPTVKETVKEDVKVASLPSDTVKPVLPPDPLAKPEPTTKPEPSTPPKPGTPVSTEVGRLSSADQVVGHFDSAKNIWRRLPRGATLFSAERYVVLPTYRPLVSLKSGMQIMFVGDASFELAPAEKMDDAGVAVYYGRAVVSTAGRAGSRVFFDFGGEQGTATFGDGDSEIAVEVRRYLPPGSDPERDPAVMLSQMFVTRGRVSWQPVEGNAVPLAAGQMRTALSGQPIQTTRFDVEPAWMDTRTISKVDRDASIELESFILVDKPLVLSLSEKTDYRKTEIRSLASRCLASLDEPEAAIRELSDERQHSYWAQSIDALREALARSPGAAENVRKMLERKRLEDGAQIYRILVDYSPQQLEADGARQLVGFLEHKSLDLRVVAFETLRRITGFTQNYRPEWSVERRNLPVIKWKEKLREGLIVYRTPPSPFPERKGSGLVRPAADDPAIPKLP